MVPQDSAPQPKKSLSLTLDYRFVVGFLVLVIIGMLLMWRPWEFRADANARTVEVTGEAKLTAVPDEFVFYPTYTFENDDKDAALKELTAKSDEVVKKLKELGVADEKIKTDSNGYDSPIYYLPAPDEERSTYTLSLNVTVGDKEKAQKVQDYLVTTSPTGSVSPQASFSDKKRKALEVKAREEATKEARAKADQSAKNLGFRVDAVKAVNDGAGFDGAYPITAEGRATDIASNSSKLAVQPGENDLTYQVTVVYYIK